MSGKTIKGKIKNECICMLTMGLVVPNTENAND